MRQGLYNMQGRDRDKHIHSKRGTYTTLTDISTIIQGSWFKRYNIGNAKNVCRRNTLYTRMQNPLSCRRRCAYDSVPVLFNSDGDTLHDWMVIGIEKIKTKSIFIETKKKSIGGSRSLKLWTKMDWMERENKCVMREIYITEQFNFYFVCTVHIIISCSIM